MGETSQHETGAGPRECKASLMVPVQGGAIFPLPLLTYPCLGHVRNWPTSWGGGWEEKSKVEKHRDTHSPPLHGESGPAGGGRKM